MSTRSSVHRVRDLGKRQKIVNRKNAVSAGKFHDDNILELVNFIVRNLAVVSQSPNKIEVFQPSQESSEQIGPSYKE